MKRSFRRAFSRGRVPRRRSSAARRRTTGGKKRKIGSSKRWQPRALNMTAQVPTTYSSIYTYKLGANTLNAPATAWELTDFGQYTKRFEAEGLEQNAALIKSGFLSYQIDVMPQTPTPFVIHIWIVSPRDSKKQSCTNLPALTAGEIGASVDALTTFNNSDPLLDWQDFRVHSYRKHTMGRTNAEATATVRERTVSGRMRFRPPKVVKNTVGNQHWRQVLTQELNWSARCFLFVWCEVTTSVTPITVTFSFASTLVTIQTLSRIP